MADKEEETTTEEDTVEDETTDTSTGESEGAEDDSSDDELKEEDTSSDSEQYLDLKAVPAPLKEAAKRMLASHTKAMQKVKAEYSKLEEHLGTKYSQSIIKSKALDQLANNPNFQLLISDIEDHKPYGYSSTFNARNGKSAVEDEDDSENTGKSSSKVDMKKINALVDKVVRDAIKPIYEKEARSSWDSAKKTFPDFEKYKPDITATLQRFPDMTLEEAYKFVTRDDAVDRAKREITSKTKEDVEALRKKPKTEKSSSGGGEAGGLSSKTVKTVKEAIEFAITQQK